MNSTNRTALLERIVRAAKASLSAQGYVAPIDVLVGIGWLDLRAVAEWRQGRVDFLERRVLANLSRISKAMHLFRSWAIKEGLEPSETHYVRRTPGRPALRFSKSGDHSVERQYRTHWVSPALREKNRRSAGEKAVHAQGGS